MLREYIVSKGLLGSIPSKQISINRYFNRIVTLLKMRKKPKQLLFCLVLSFLLATFSTTLVHGGQVDNRQSDRELVAVDNQSKSSSILKPGDESPEVLQLQQQLRTLGFYLSPTTGYYDETTTEAVRAFKQQQKLPLTDVADAKTLNTLENAFDNTRKEGFKLGDVRYGVRSIQAALRVSQTGVYDSATEKAVRAFQVRQGLVVDGIADPVTLSALGLPYNLGGYGVYGGGGGAAPGIVGPEVTRGDLSLKIVDDEVVNNKVQLGKGYEVEFRLKGKAITQFAPRLRALSNSPNADFVKFTTIRVKLNAPDSDAFKLDPNKGQDDIIINKNGEVVADDVVPWRWNVTPLKAGFHTLSADVGFVYEKSNGSEPKISRFDFKPQDRTLKIQVETSLSQKVDLFVEQMSWVQKTITALTGICVAIALALSPPLRKVWTCFQSLRSKSSASSPSSSEKEPPSSTS